MSPEALAPPSSILGALAEHLPTCPDQVCYSVLSFRDDQRTETVLTFDGLANRCWHVASELAARGAQTGDRIILALPEPGQFASCFLGALTAGLIPVPLPGVGEFGTPVAAIDRIKGVCLDCAPKFAITESKVRWDAIMGDAALSLKVFEVADLGLPGRARPAHFRLPDPPGSAPAFIQYTSGSTGKPRGVVVTHANILANLRGMSQSWKLGPEDIVVLWLPLFHDMGLVSMLTSLVLKNKTILFPSSWFVYRPILWLRTIAQYRATVSPAPVFAFNFCYQRLTDHSLQGLDLASWRVALVGAEPIPVQAMQGFIDRFRPFGFAAKALLPVYGLAEATLQATAPDPGEGLIIDRVQLTRREGKHLALPRADQDSRSSPAGLAQANSECAQGSDFISVGRAIPGHTVQVIDPETGERCVERQIGEVVLQGPSVTPRYWHEDASQVRKRLCTGDLGYQADGRLYIIDRIKDLIIIAGQNYFPADIEASIARIPQISVERSAVFSMPGGDRMETLIVAVEVASKNRDQVGEIKRNIARVVRKHHGLEVAQIFCVPRGTLPRTTSGKIQRRACKEMSCSGALAAAQFI